MRWTVVMAIVLLVPAMSGCLGGDDEGGDGGLETQSTAQFTADTGGIEGLITDSAVQPIEDAVVEITETGETATTREDGSFAFSEITPGTYTLAITAEGFLGTEKQIDVPSGDVATTEIVLAHEPTVEPFMQQFELKGFLECSAAIPDTLADVAPYGAVAVCGIPNTVLSQVGDNASATNDKFLFYQTIEENPWQMVAELTWDGSQTTQEMSLAVEAEGFANNASGTFAAGSGPDPLILRTDRASIASLVGNLSAACEGGDENACNRNYIENGGPIQLRTFVDGTDTEPGVAIQQDYTLFLSVFYNTPACEDYSLAEETTCPQQDRAPQEDPYEGQDTTSPDG